MTVRIPESLAPIRKLRDIEVGEAPWGVVIR